DLSRESADFIRLTVRCCPIAIGAHLSSRNLELTPCPSSAKPPIVRSNHDGSGIVGERVFESRDEAEREVVRGFVKEQDFGWVGQKRGESKATLLSEAEFDHGSVLITGGNQTEGAQRHLRSQLSTDKVHISLSRCAPGPAVVRVGQGGLLRE